MRHSIQKQLWSFCFIGVKRGPLMDRGEYYTPGWCTLKIEILQTEVWDFVKLINLGHSP